MEQGVTVCHFVQNVAQQFQALQLRSSVDLAAGVTNTLLIFGLMCIVCACPWVISIQEDPFTQGYVVR